MATLIIEESEQPNGDRMATVRTSLGYEFIVNVDALVKSMAESAAASVYRSVVGWPLPAEWFQVEHAMLREHLSVASADRPQDEGD